GVDIEVEADQTEPEPPSTHLRPDRSWVVPYAVAPLRSLAPSTLADPAHRSEVAALLRDLVAVEGPVHEDRATRRVLEAGDRKPAAARLVERAVGLAVARGWVRERGAFLHRPGAPPRHIRVPVDKEPETRRDLAEIPPEEVTLAAELLLSEEDELDA